MLLDKIERKDIDRADKQGFLAPDSSWFKNECREMVDSVIQNKNARIWEILDPKTVQGLVAEHMDGSQNRRLLIWSLLNFNELLNTWF